MGAQESFQTLKSFFETRQAPRQVLTSLPDGIEIGIVIGEQIECALFRRNGVPVVEQRAAQNPDVVFHLKPETVELLDQRTKDEIGDIGLNIFKEIVAGQIKVKVPGSVSKLLRHGYLEMLASGGPRVRDFMFRHGLSGVPKIINAIKKMR